MGENTRIVNNGYHLPDYFGRDFVATRPMPQQGRCGGQRGMAEWTDRESCLRPCNLRMPKGCSDNLMYPDQLLYNWMPHEWQQPDFRCSHFTNGERMQVKDICRYTPSCDDDCKPREYCSSDLSQPFVVNHRPVMHSGADHGQMSTISVFETRFV